MKNYNFKEGDLVYSIVFGKVLRIVRFSVFSHVVFLICPKTTKPYDSYLEHLIPEEIWNSSLFKALNEL